MSSRVYHPKKLSSTAYLELVELIRTTCNAPDPLRVSGDIRAFAQDAKRSSPPDLQLSVAASLLADLAEQSWRMWVDGETIHIAPPSAKPMEGEELSVVKSRLRRGLMVSSNRQLASPSVQDFLQRMEKNRVFEDSVVSVRSVIDDGADLSANIAILRAREDAEQALAGLIKPYIQICGSDDKCSHTGLKLLDIWRYFRHTWALEYNPIPGRMLRVLVRNRARKNHPVIGIAMLASPAANLYKRDAWIGWRTEDLIQNILDGTWSAKHVAQTLIATVLDSISDIRHDDLVTPEELQAPQEETFEKLKAIATDAVKSRRSDLIARPQKENGGKVVDIRCLNKEKLTEQDWKILSETSLYVKKRAEQLEPLLRALKALKDADFETAPAAALYEVLATKRGQKMVSFVLNEIRKKRLATEVADVSVCGAIEPYNHLLGGKLVTLLMGSREMRTEYQNRYEGQVSEIASQIAGRPITRPAKLHILTTTSLYGLASSQYNRLALKTGFVPQLKSEVRWKDLGQTDGITITHLSKLTVEYMRELAIETYGTKRVNSVFGEGSSPKTRQIREGLSLIGIESDNILKQGLPRRVYACELYPGARDNLHGLGKKHRETKGPSQTTIAQAWIKRWVASRIKNDAILEKVAGSGPDNIVAGLKSRAETAEFELSQLQTNDVQGQLFPELE